MTATFASPVTSFGIVYAHEYSGVLQTAPLDVTAAASGTSGSLNSGSVITNNAVDLLFAGGVSATIVTSPGSGYVARSTAQGNITEDRIASAVNSYNATASNQKGAWAMQMVAFKAASGTVDSTPPTAPTGLAVTGTTTSTVSLSWAASTDNVGVAGYKIFRSGAQVGTSGTTAYTDSGLAPSMTYSYTVSAYDAAGNTSAQSSVIQATTKGDTTPPTVPTGLSVTGTTASTISLSWNASTDNFGVVGYKIYRAGLQVGTPSATSFTDTGLMPSTAYSYTVSAYDAAGNNSAPSSAVQATTSAQADTTPPTVPTGLTVTGTTVNTASLSWTASTDNVGVTGYKIYRAGVQVGTTSATSYTDTGLAASTAYSYSVSAYDAAGNTSAPSSAIQATTQPDTTPPTAPTALSMTASTTSSVSLSWAASTDNVGVAGYKIFRSGTQMGTSGTTSYTDTGLEPTTTYSYTVSAYDAAGNNSAPSPAMQATTKSDTTPPTVPTGLSVTGVTTSTVSLSWSASSDNVGVAGYKIYRAGLQTGTTSATSFIDTGLTASTAYSYTVSAYDAAGNNSASSSAVQATTSAQPDTTPPTTPTGLSVTGTTVSTASLSWIASTDNVGVTAYKIYRAGTQIATSASTSYTDSGLAASTTYAYTVSAYDAAGNNSAQTSPVSATTAAASSGSYSTTFPLTESPISEGGNWTNGGTAGLDWTDVQTTPNFAFGTMPGEASGGAQYADSTATVNGTWGPNQTVQATVSVNGASTSSSVFEEVELRLHTTITSHSITGYEINCSVSTASGHNYVQIVRWNGPLASFTLLDSRANGPCVDGDVLKATISGSTITVYRNGTSLFSVTDSTYPTGNPGIGFFLQGATGVNASYGFSDFSASDGSTLDTTPPSTPTNLAAVVVSSSQINLTWTASTDNVAVAGYQVFRNGTQITSTAAPAYFDTTVVPGTQYTYAIAAFDSTGNVSPLSSPATVTISSVPDTTPPSVPQGLQALNVTSTSLTLSWTASTDNVAVAGYQIFRNGAQVGTATATSYADAGLMPSTGYVYTVTAYDTSNNVSAPSQQLAVTTTSGAVTPPSFVQVNNNQISSGGSTSVTLNAPTVAGNTIVAYLIWNNTGSAAVSDSRGDTFIGVGSPLSWGNGYSAQVFYAAGILGGTDTVTATFRTPVTSFGVLYVHEYTGISTTSPMDVTVSASGSSGSLNSGLATTTAGNDLIFGAGVSDNMVTAAGSGFTSRDMAYGNITEDRAAGSIGSYSATATHSGKMWAMQMVAFRAAH